MNNEQLIALRLGGWTNVQVANLLGSDYPSSPTPVHIACYDRNGGERNGWRRLTNLRQTIVRVPGRKNTWYTLRDADGTWHDLPAGATCWFCGGIV